MQKNVNLIQAINIIMQIIKKFGIEQVLNYEKIK